MYKRNRPVHSRRSLALFAVPRNGEDCHLPYKAQSPQRIRHHSSSKGQERNTQYGNAPDISDIADTMYEGSHDLYGQPPHKHAVPWIYHDQAYGHQRDADRFSLLQCAKTAHHNFPAQSLTEWHYGTYIRSHLDLRASLTL